MVLKIFFLLAFLAQFSPLVLFFVFFKRINKIVELRVIFLYALSSLISIFFLGAFKNYASLIISIFAMIEYVFFATFFYLCIRNNKFKTFIIIISILNLSLDVFLFYSPKANFDFWDTLITTILIVIYCIFFFYEQLNSPQYLFIYQSYTFWVVVGCLIYLSGTLFLFLYTSDIKNKERSPLWNINIVFEIVKNLFFSIAFIVAKKNNNKAATQNFDNTNRRENPF